MPTPQSYFKDCGGDFTKLRLTPVTPWIAVYQAPLSMGFPGQEYCSELPFPSPGDLLHPEIEPVSPALQADSLSIQYMALFFSFFVHHCLANKPQSTVN